MATSGTYSFTVTRDDIIRMAMLFLGKLGENETPTASETVDCSAILNMMVKQWMGRNDFAPGLKVWTRKRADLYLSSTTGRYSIGPSGDHWTETSYTTTLTAASAISDTTLTVASISNANASDYIGVELDDGSLHWTTINGAPSGSTITITTGVASAAASGNRVFFYTTKAQRPLLLDTVVLRNVEGEDTPIDVITLQDYEFLPSKADTDFKGDPTAVYYEPQLTNGVIYTDVGGAQDVTKKLHITFMEPVQDFSAATDNPHYPQEWYMALCWGLARQICPMFNAVWTEEMKINYAEALAMAKESNPEIVNMYFQPGET